MQKPKVHDNQQVTLAYQGGLWDGEGHFSVCKIQNKKRYQYKAQVAISNTDPVLIDKMTDFLEDMNIAYYIRLRAKSSTGKNQYEVSINSLDSQNRFLEMILPHLNGCKKSEASLVHKFVKRRMQKNNSPQPRRSNGTFVGNNKAPYTEEEEEFLQEYRKLKVPQRLHVMPLPKAIQAKEG